MEMISKITPFGLRLPRELKEWAEKRSTENGRSLNSEITEIIKATKQADNAKEAM